LFVIRVSLYLCCSEGRAEAPEGLFGVVNEGVQQGTARLEGAVRALHWLRSGWGSVLMVVVAALMASR
jgi:hypothetical protein